MKSLKRKWLIVLVVIMAMGIGTICYAAINTNLIQPLKPEVVDLHLSWGKITDTETEIHVKAMIYNPNNIRISIKIEDLILHFNEITLAWIDSAVSIDLAPKKTSSVETTLIIDNTKLKDVLIGHIKRGEISTIRVDLELTILRFPISIERPVTTNILEQFSGKITD